MGQACELFGISRQAYYQKYGQELKRQSEEEQVLTLVRQVKHKHPNMGVRKILDKLQPVFASEHLPMGRDRLFELLRGQDLLVQRRKTHRHTTIPGLWRAPNRLPGLTIDHPNQVWVCDITYLDLVVGRFAYLFVLMDLYARYILGWHVSSSLAADGALLSLDMALSQQSQLPSGVIHHSDHGVQYTSQRYLQTLLDHQFLPSMGAVGNCYDNIFAERLMGILKHEYNLDAAFLDLSQASSAVAEVVQLYNTDRPHLSLNMAVPAAVYSGYSLDIPVLMIPPAPP
jgi:putative transposase